MSNWGQLWRKAKANMPSTRQDGHTSSTLLRQLLGYKIVKDDGTPLSCSQHVFSAATRGDKPRDLERQRLLKMLAGPHSRAVIKIIAIKRGIDLSKYKHWN